MHCVPKRRSGRLYAEFGGAGQPFGHLDRTGGLVVPGCEDLEPVELEERNWRRDHRCRFPQSWLSADLDKLSTSEALPQLVELPAKLADGGSDLGHLGPQLVEVSASGPPRCLERWFSAGPSRRVGNG